MRGRIGSSATQSGTEAHVQFQRLNRRLNRRLVDAGADFRVAAEEFRFANGEVARRNARGSIGADALIKDLDDNILRNLDLKTHAPHITPTISNGRQADFLLRFGQEAEIISRTRP